MTLKADKAGGPARDFKRPRGRTQAPGWGSFVGQSRHPWKGQLLAGKMVENPIHLGARPMSRPVILDLDEATLGRLREQATRHGRTVESEAKMILAGALPPAPAAQWAQINTAREHLARSG